MSVESQRTVIGEIKCASESDPVIIVAVCDNGLKLYWQAIAKLKQIWGLRHRNFTRQCALRHIRKCSLSQLPTVSTEHWALSTLSRSENRLSLQNRQLVFATTEAALLVEGWMTVDCSKQQIVSGKLFCNNLYLKNNVNIEHETKDKLVRKLAGCI